jgi:ABC-type uncharacterized transport system permease subunit
MKNIGIFNGNFVHLLQILHILWPFATFVVMWYIFPVLVCILQQEKSGNPDSMFKPFKKKRQK